MIIILIAICTENFQARKFTLKEMINGFRKSYCGSYEITDTEDPIKKCRVSVNNAL